MSKSIYFFRDLNILHNYFNDVSVSSKMMFWVQIPCIAYSMFGKLLNHSVPWFPNV